MFEGHLEVAKKAAALAGDYLREEYARFQAIPDAPADITTDADRQTQEIILQHLHAAFPQDALCAEEETATLAGLARTNSRLWVIDPIDGTRGFARKNGEFSVMIAFLDQGRIEMGLVLQPTAEKLTWAVRGAGCWRSDQNQASVPCRVSGEAKLSRATLVQSRSRRSGELSPSVAALGPAKIVETYSAGLKLAMVARGEADIYLNTYAAFHDWDICAGHILVAEAGGTVTGLKGEELCYGLPGAWQRQGLLASNGQVHEEALAKLKDF